MLNAQLIESLNFLDKTYEGINKMITSTKNRLHYLSPESQPKHQPILVGKEKKGGGLETIKSQISRQMEQELEMVPIWTEWLSKIRGVGPAIAVPLIVSWNAKFVAVCSKCGADLEEFTCPKCKTEAKGEGILQHRMTERDFPQISKWISYCGMKVDSETGKKCKRAKGQVANWNSRNRTVLWHFGSKVAMSKDPFYEAFYRERKAKREQTHPDLKPFIRNAMACHETAKLFASHFWTVQRHMEGKPVTMPYQHAILGHTNLIMPPYFDGNIEFVDVQYSWQKVSENAM